MPLSKYPPAPPYQDFDEDNENLNRFLIRESAFGICISGFPFRMYAKRNYYFTDSYNVP